MLPRHLQSYHKEKREVVEIVSLNDPSARKKHLLKILNVGNHRHNCQVIQGGEGVLIVGYCRPKHKAVPHDYAYTVYCIHVCTCM